MTTESAPVSLEENSEAIARPAVSRMQKIQPFVIWTIGLYCLAQGLDFLFFPDAIAAMIGLGLLTAVPGFCYFGWRDYRKLSQAQAQPASRLAAAVRRAADAPVA